MNDINMVRVFFFITATAMVVVGILAAVLTGYLIKIARDVKYISRKARQEADLISDDLSELRENVRERGAKMRYFLSFFNNLANHKKKGK